MIYPEIYHDTRSTASLETRENPTGIQKQTCEEAIIEMFGLLENIKELIPASSPIPDLTLDLGPALPLEENNFLDYLNDNNIILFNSSIQIQHISFNLKGFIKILIAFLKIY